MKSQCSLITISSLFLLLAVTTNSQGYPPGSCGEQAGGTLCAPGFCCSNWGFCGTTSDYCDPDKCQSQCPSPPPPPPPPPPPSMECGILHGGATCPSTMCCSVEGFCENSKGPKCSNEFCQSQCGGEPTCGVDAGGEMPCLINECCTIAGFCAPLFGPSCRAPFCQSQCLFGQDDEPLISIIEAVA